MIEGACHCGHLSWRFDADPVSATACNCTICRRYGALWAYGHEGETVTVTGETRIYMHGDRDLEFHSCARCGCIGYWRQATPGEDGRRRIGVNLRLAALDAVAALPLKHLDGFETWRSVPRDTLCVGDIWF